MLFETPSMRACSSTPPKQNQDFVKEHNRTHLMKLKTKVICRISLAISRTLRPILTVIYVVKDNVEKLCNLSFGRNGSLKTSHSVYLQRRNHSGREWWLHRQTWWVASFNLRLFKSLTNLTQSHMERGGSSIENVQCRVTRQLWNNFGYIQQVSDRFARFFSSGSWLYSSKLLPETGSQLICCERLPWPLLNWQEKCCKLTAFRTQL